MSTVTQEIAENTTAHLKKIIISCLSSTLFLQLHIWIFVVHVKMWKHNRVDPLHDRERKLRKHKLFQNISAKLGHSTDSHQQMIIRQLIIWQMVIWQTVIQQTVIPTTKKTSFLMSDKNFHFLTSHKNSPFLIAHKNSSYIVFLCQIRISVLLCHIRILILLCHIRISVFLSHIIIWPTYLS